MATFPCGGAPLTDAGLHAACDKIGVKAAEIWAVVFVETDPPYGGFWPSAAPQILYERHIFSRLTKRKFDNSNPDISSKKPGNYGASGDHQYDRLKKAATLDASAALQSASWGIGQTLGTNFKEAGFSNIDDLVLAMFSSEDAQLLAAVNEMISTGCADALAHHNWRTFARIYNGANFEINNYDQKLAAQYARFATGDLPDLRMRAAQFYLIYVGFDPGPIDGFWGKRVRAALHSYQDKKKIKQTDALDDTTFNALEADFKAKIASTPPFVV